ncbi:MazG nucleotide pyrophosphohydrolase domain-containing protein [Nocardia tengchongensis]|uniref:MazG nucleotide pyrophosphohydrolase domain-containing protein n=1 Tax=Nocardia tengchongensis TaxID=2055889 RepID=UPI00367D4585
MASLIGVEIWVERVADPAADAPSVTISRTTNDLFVIAVCAATWDHARALATEPVLGVIAYLTGRLYLQCSLLHTTQHTEVVLLSHDHDPRQSGIGPAAVSGPHVLIDAEPTPPTAVALCSDELWHSPSTVGNWPVGAVAIVNGDDGGYVSPKMMRPHLAGSAGITERRSAEMIRGAGSSRLLAAFDAARRQHVEGLMSAAPGVAVDYHQLSDWIDHGDMHALLGAPPIQYPASAAAGLRAVQRTALQVYGRHHPDASFVWTVEELGELAAALRRGESPARLREEIGQAFNWLLCLANIHDLDLAECSNHALVHEARRQLACHGTLRPARSADIASQGRS